MVKRKPSRLKETKNPLPEGALAESGQDAIDTLSTTVKKRQEKRRIAPSQKKKKKEKNYWRYFDPDRDDFNAAMQRVHEITQTSTQKELADILGIRQSSISDATKRKSIPPDWFLKIFNLYGINPEWIKRGGDYKYIQVGQEIKFEKGLDIYLQKFTKKTLIMAALLGDLPEDLYNEISNYMYIDDTDFVDISLHTLENIIPPALLKKVHQAFTQKKNNSKEEKYPPSLA